VSDIGKSALASPVIDTAEAQAALLYASETEAINPHQISIDRLAVRQQHELYTVENHEVWHAIVQKRMAHLEGEDAGSRVFLEGARAVALTADKVPCLADVNERLQSVTGWTSFGVPGYLPAKAFFACLAQRQFPTTITVRPKSSMNYLPEPDIIHDVFGHVPLHADPSFSDFLQTWGQAALNTDDPIHTERLSRLFWFTVEFGLIREEGRLKLYGSGLISSEGEGRYALESSDVDRRPFDLEMVCNTPFEIDRYQPILYVLDSFEQLRDAMHEYADQIPAAR
jgi:phenylalanine-4-hydroxylase